MQLIANRLQCNRHRQILQKTPIYATVIVYSEIYSYLLKTHHDMHREKRNKGSNDKINTDIVQKHSQLLFFPSMTTYEAATEAAIGLFLFYPVTAL